MMKDNLDQTSPISAGPGLGSQEKEMQNAALKLKNERITRVKEFRVQLDAILQQGKYFRDTILPQATLQNYDLCRQSILAVDAIELAMMRFGMVLKELDAPNPYPNSKNPANTIVDPTADGLRF